MKHVRRTRSLSCLARRSGGPSALVILLLALGACSGTSRGERPDARLARGASAPHPDAPLRPADAATREAHAPAAPMAIDAAAPAAGDSVAADGPGRQPDGGVAAAPDAPAAPPAPAPPAGPPPAPGASGCAERNVGNRLVALCPDAASHDAWLATRGDPLPPPGSHPAPLRDPVRATSGLKLYRYVVDRIARVAKFTPVLFDGVPDFSEAQWAAFAADRRLWRDAQAYWRNLRSQDGGFKSLRARFSEKQPAALRQVILRDGYLFTLDRLLSRRIYKTVRLTDLFHEARIYLQRGDRVLPLERRDTGYVYAAGPETGLPATLLLFDRVGLSPDEFAVTRHLDLEGVRMALGLHRVAVTAAEQGRAVGNVHFLTGDTLPATVVRVSGRTAVVLDGVEPAAFDALVEENRRRMRANLRILAIAETFIDEAIKFDEPDNEIGQQDGVLRFEWIRAYENGKDQYGFNGVGYAVFDRHGRPQAPQVCVDYLTDSLERATGSWWGGRDEPREKRRGPLRWSDHPALNPRSVPSLVRFARRHPDMLDLFMVPAPRRIPYRLEERFYANLADFPVDFHEADMVLIFGKREDEQNHNHSFFVHRIDPIGGMPLMAADNAGMARTRPLDDVLRKSPRRWIHRRIRPHPEWLLALGLGEETPPLPQFDKRRGAWVDWLMGAESAPEAGPPADG